jgi:hypothetical protein
MQQSSRMRASISLIASASLLMIIACDRTTDDASTSPATPQQYAFASADEALQVLKETSQGMGGRCGTFSHALGGTQEGSTGELSCFKLSVSPSPGRWHLNLWTYSDDFYAESGYRESCALIPRHGSGGWWLIWQPGQNWFAEINADVDVGGPTPPEFVATAVAEVLHSTAWNDCGAVK